jgi:hypothetical protein
MLSISIIDKNRRGSANYYRKVGYHLPNYNWGYPHGRESKPIKPVSQQNRKLLESQLPLAEPVMIPFLFEFMSFCREVSVQLILTSP